MFGFHPQHILTRGRFDGQYGIATRGLLICPDIVPRYAHGACVYNLCPLAVLEHFDLEACLTEDDALAVLEHFGLEATLSDDGDLAACVDTNAQPNC